MRVARRILIFGFIWCARTLRIFRVLLLTRPSYEQLLMSLLDMVTTDKAMPVNTAIAARRTKPVRKWVAAFPANISAFFLSRHWKAKTHKKKETFWVYGLFEVWSTKRLNHIIKIHMDTKPASIYVRWELIESKVSHFSDNIDSAGSACTMWTRHRQFRFLCRCCNNKNYLIHIVFARWIEALEFAAMLSNAEIFAKLKYIWILCN